MEMTERVVNIGLSSGLALHAPLRTTSLVGLLRVLQWKPKNRKNGHVDCRRLPCPNCDGCFNYWSFSETSEALCVNSH